jgi:hypothetical protein
MSYIVKLTEDQAPRSAAFPIEAKVYSAGVIVKPTSATVTVRDPAGTEVLAATAMNVETAGPLTYLLAAAKTAELWENAIIEINYMIATVVYRATFFFDVVLTPLACDVVDDDLKAYFPLLADEIWAGTTSYSGQIAEAFRTVKRLIKDKGKRPAMLIDGSQVRELVVIKTFEMIFFNFSKDPEDVWWKRYEKYAAIFAARFAALEIKYDEDESGSIEADEESGLGQLTLIR